MIKKCPDCSAETSQNSEICPLCGHKFSAFSSVGNKKTSNDNERYGCALKLKMFAGSLTGFFGTLFSGYCFCEIVFKSNSEIRRRIDNFDILIMAIIIILAFVAENLSRCIYLNKQENEYIALMKNCAKVILFF